MTTRRGFLAGILATAAPTGSWADVGRPKFVTAGRQPDGQHVLAGLSRLGDLLFRHALPGRGHAASAHPLRPEIIAFARRPGQFADVLDCRDGSQITRLTPPAGHHFYGHGCYSAEGDLLFTTENEFDTGRGIIGVWDSRARYRRIGSFASGGIGPHDILRTPQGHLVIANGGIETHPDSGRAKLNLPTMQSNLSYLTPEGSILDQITLAPEMRMNSIRHLTQAKDGTVGFAMQWQGDPSEVQPIVGLHRRGQAPRLLADGDPRLRHLKGYGGSVAFSPDGSRIAVSSPRGNRVQIMSTRTGALEFEHQLIDACGLAPAGAGWMATTGSGQMFDLSHSRATLIGRSATAWDNHLIPLA